MEFRKTITKISLKLASLLAMTVVLLAFGGGVQVKADPTPDYLIFTALKANSQVKIGWLTGENVEYSTDGENWTGITTEPYTITLANVGDYVKIRATNLTTGISSSDCFGIPKGEIKASGSVTSLTDRNGGDSEVALQSSCYAYMFSYCGNRLKDVSELKLPATTLKDNCYYKMFQDCSAIEVAPELRATTLDTQCYRYMFNRCSALKVAPELPATVLAEKCYEHMFDSCSALKVAPELRATTLAKQCCYYMFSGCSALKVAPELPVTTLAEQCYAYMFNACSAIEVAPELPATVLAEKCYEHMFDDCSALKVAPALPAETLAPFCYRSMFDSCTSLESAPALPATVLTENCYDSMFYDCKKLIDAPALPATTIAKNCYNSMFKGCTSLEVAPELPATTIQDQSYLGMFWDCTSLVTPPPVLPATVLPGSCYAYMFNGCTSLERPPLVSNEETKLDNWCFGNMFNGCTSLQMWYEEKPEAQLQTPWIITGTISYGNPAVSMFEGCTNPNFNLNGDFTVGNTYYVKGAVPPPTKYSITVTSGGNGTAYANRSMAAEGEMLTLTATPSTGYRLKEWEVTSGTVAIEANNTFIMPASNVVITAVFEVKPSYTVSVSSEDESKGTVSTSLETATEGTSVTITATPTSAYVFDKWVDVSGVTIDETKASVTFTMPDGNVSAKATFKEPAPDKYKININPDIEHGSIGVDKTEAAAGETVTLTVTPEEGYEFNAWEANVEIKDNKFEMPGNAVNITAFFKKAQPKPNPNPDNDTSSSSEPARVFVDLDTNKSEVEYGTVFMHNKDNVKMIFDMKVHSVDARTKANQEFLAASYAKNQGKRARIILTTGIYPRNKLNDKDIGTKKFLSYLNLEKKVQPVYAVCYNQDDKAYYLTGTINANGTAVFTDFIARDATNITIFVLE